MNRSLAWKITLALIVAQLFFALSPIVTYACVGSGTHGGC